MTTDPDAHFHLYFATGFFDAETCREMIAEMRAATGNRAVTYGQGEPRVDERVRKVTRLMISRETVGHVTQKLLEHRERVREHFGISLGNCEEPQFLCYRVGDFFVAHQDGNTGLLRLETDRTRRISLSIFLNRQSETPEPGTYCGGSLVFSDCHADREVPIAGQAGELVAFRSEITHEVLPVTDGARYSIVTWFGVGAR